MMKENCTNVPKGTQEFVSALERLRNAPINCNNRFELANQCCKLCNRSINCEECYVQTVGDLNDPYRKEIQKRSKTGMYTTGIYKDKNGNYYYSHPQGSD